MVSLREYQQRVSASDLTIVTVSFKAAKLLKKNIELSRDLNVAQRPWWLVVDNDFEIEDHWIDDDRVVVIPGTYLTSEENASICYGSLHHSKSVMIGVSYATTDKILILDPDCLIVMKEWVPRILENMERKNLSFWGTPYHPTRLWPFSVWGRIYPNFPNVICMLIDRKRIQSEHGFLLDFTPPIVAASYRKKYWFDDLQPAMSLMVEAESNRARLAILTALVRKRGVRSIFDVLRFLPSKWSIDRRQEIGYQIFTRYSRKCRHDCIPFFFDRKFPRFFWLWKYFVPQSLIGYPKRQELWRTEPMTYVPPNYIAQGAWEQYFFDDQPFAVHVGKVSYAHADAEAQIDQVLTAVRKENEIVR